MAMNDAKIRIRIFCGVGVMQVHAQTFGYTYRRYTGILLLLVLVYLV